MTPKKADPAYPVILADRGEDTCLRASGGIGEGA